MKQRDIVVSIILTIVTCGIYGFYWMACVTDDIGDASGDKSMNGTTAVILTIVTCGIYGYFWAYKMGELLTKAKSTQVGVTTSSDLPVLYLVLQIFGLEIVNLALMQNELNNMQL